MKQGTCKHFTGIQKKVCAIGVAYDDFDGLPCFSDNKAHGQCSKYTEATAEELAADKAERDAMLAETMRKIAAATPTNTTAPYNVWFDEAAPGQEFTHDEFVAHLKAVYGIDAKSAKGKRSMVTHMDGAEWYGYVWDWEIDGRHFTQSTRDLRRGEDADMWRHA